MVKCFFLIFPGNAESFPCDTNAALNCHPGGFLHTCITRCQQWVKSHYIRINVLLRPHGEIAENTGRDHTSPCLRNTGNIGSSRTPQDRGVILAKTSHLLQPLSAGAFPGKAGLCSLGLECGQIPDNELHKLASLCSFPGHSQGQVRRLRPPQSDELKLFIVSLLQN